MATEIKKQTKSKLATVSDNVKDYGKDPFFIKKAKQSKVFLEKHGFPKELMASRSTLKKKMSA